jgi:hypothetical protein
MGRVSSKVLHVSLVALTAVWLVSCGGGGTTPPLPPPISVTVSPQIATITVGNTLQFTARVTGTSNPAVAWNINGIAGGNPEVGLINSNGLYTAPPVPPFPNVITVTAASKANLTHTGSASATIVNPSPALSSLFPNIVDAGSSDTTVTVSGTGFAQQSVVTVGNTPLTTTFGSPSQLTATVLAAQLSETGTLQVAVSTPSPGGGTSNAMPLTVIVVVALSPQTQNLEVGQTQPFTATITGSSNQNVSWLVNGVSGGNSTVGTISAAGLYTAPLIPPSPNVVTVTATSIVDTARSASSTISVVNPMPVLSTVSPLRVNVGSGNTALTLTGTALTQQSIVQFGSTSLATTYSSPTQLTATLPSAQLASPGKFPITVDTPSPGGGTSNPLSFTVSQPPAITNANDTRFAAGLAGTFTVTTTGYPTPTLSESGPLPMGITFDPTTGVLSGTPAADTGGTYAITFKATNGVTPDATQNFTLTVNQPPAITSTASTAFTVGAAGSFTVATTGFPSPTLNETGTLPSGLAFNASSGVLSGIPAAGTGGTYDLIFTATNGVGSDATQNFILTNHEAPTVSSPGGTVFNVATPGSFTITATGFPAPTLTETGALPTGVTFDASTGVLSGTPGAGTGGNYNISFKASNGIGTDAAQSFVLTVNQAPEITSPASATFEVGTAGSLTVTATGFPAPTLIETGALPSGLTFNASTGVLNGTPGAGTGGTYNVSLKATNGVGTDATQSFTLTVNQPSAITSATNTTFSVGTAESFTVTATGYPLPTLSQTGALPSGVSFDASTGVLSGTPAVGTGGVYSLTFKASSGSGTDATQSFTLTVSQAPAITSAGSAGFTVGTAGSFTVTATGYPSPTLSETGALPSGVTFNTSTGVLSGTPGANAGGTYPLTFTASNGVGTNATQDFTLTVENPAPVLYSISPTAATAGDPRTTLTVGGASFTRQSVVYFDASALSTSYGSATQLNATIPSTLLVSAGNFSITVMTSGPGGGASTSLDFTVWPSYPRTGAGGVLSGALPALTQITQTGTAVSVLDWTSKDAYGSPEDVLAADHLVSELGIPSNDITSVPNPSTNPFLLAAGVLNNNLTSSDVTALTNYVSGGGTLYLWQPDVLSLLTALGIPSLPNDYYQNVTQEEQRPLSFIATGADDPLLKYIDDPEEINWAPFFPVDDVTRGYAEGSCTPLAEWSTGDYAVLRCDLGKGTTTGHAYVFGWRLRPLLSLPERQLGNDTGPQSTNQVVPDADIVRMLMRGSYEGYAANPQERQWAPGGHRAALIITHDVDAAVSYQNIPAWVDFEESLGIKSTYFFTTNPYDNGWIEPMYTASGLEDIQYALSHGFEVQDHSFGHFPDFSSAAYSLTSPPSETASNYQPMYSMSTGTTSGMSVIGELGVSKWLLQNDFSVPVTSFRAGYLDAPTASSGYPRIILLKGLSATGYRRDSTYALALTRGSFPFVLFDEDSSTGTVTPYRVMEYPLDISGDQVPVLDSTTINDYLSKWETVIRFNYDNNAPTILLLHPIDTQIRFQALQQLITDLQNQGLDLWIGDLKTFAQFWESQGVTNAKGW